MNALSQNDNIQLNETIAPHNRERGTGNITGLADITLTPTTANNENVEGNKISSISNSTATDTSNMRQAPSGLADR